MIDDKLFNFTAQDPGAKTAHGHPQEMRLVGGHEAAQDGEHHEEHDADNQGTKNQAKYFRWVKLSHDIVPNYWMEPLAEIHCFSTD